MWTAKTLIRLGRCPGWSVFAGRTVILLVLSWGGSHTCYKDLKFRLLWNNLLVFISFNAKQILSSIYMYICDCGNFSTQKKSSFHFQHTHPQAKIDSALSWINFWRVFKTKKKARHPEKEYDWMKSSSALNNYNPAVWLPGINCIVWII